MHTWLFHVHVDSCVCMCIFYSFGQRVKLWTECILSLEPFSQYFFEDLFSSVLPGDMLITLRETVFHRILFSKDFLLSFFSLLMKWESHPGKGIVWFYWEVFSRWEEGSKDERNKKSRRKRKEEQTKGECLMMFSGEDLERNEKYSSSTWQLDQGSKFLVKMMTKSCRKTSVLFPSS